MSSERDLIGEWGIENVTTALCSFRLPPCEDTEDVDPERGADTEDAYPWDTSKKSTPTAPPTVDGDGPQWYAKVDNRGRRWLPPVQLDMEIRQRTESILSALRYHLSEFEFHYLWMVGTTESANTPHLHLYVWIDDPNHEITAEDFRPVVSKFPTDENRARPEHHRVNDGQSDAAVVENDAVLYDHTQPPDDAGEGETPKGPNTAGLTYILNQRPEWALERIENGESSFGEERIALEGVATSWASPFDWVGSSRGFSLS